MSDPTQDAVRELTIRAKSTQGETRTIDALIAAVRAATIAECVAVVEGQASEFAEKDWDYCTATTKDTLAALREGTWAPIM